MHTFMLLMQVVAALMAGYVIFRKKGIPFGMAYTAALSGVRSSASYPSAQLMPDIERMLMLLEPYQTPFLQWLFFSDIGKSKKVINKQGQFSWFEDEYFPYQTTINGAFTGGSATGTLNVATGTGTYFRQYDVILMETNDQLAYISSISTDALSISTMSGGGTLAAANSGDYVKILGNQVNEYSTFPTALSTEAIQVSNYLNIFTETVATTGRDEAGEAWTDGESHDEQLEKKIKELKLKVERYFMLANVTPATQTISSYLWTFGKGLNGFITTNAAPYTSGSLSETTWNNYWKNVFAKGSNHRMHYVGSQQLVDINTLFGSKSVPTTTITTEYGVAMTRWLNSFGSVDIIWDPVLDGKYSKYGFSIDPGTVRLRYMNNDKKGSRKFRVEENVETPGTDGTTDKILMDVGIEVVNQEKNGKLYGQ